MIVFSRSSNCPRYLVPATISDRSSARMRLSARNDGTSPSLILCARPSTIAVFADPGLADQHRIVLRPAAQNLHHPLQFAIAPDQRVQRPSGGLRQVAAELGQQRRLLRTVRRNLLRRTSAQSPRAPATAAVRVRAESRPQSTSLRAATPAAGARSRCACGSTARPLRRHTPAHACTRGSAADRRSWTPSPGSSCALRSACESIRWRPGPQEPVRQRLVFAQQPEQQMLGFDVRAAELAGLIPREEDDPRAFSVYRSNIGYIPAVTSARPPCCRRKTRSHDRAKSRLCVT
jgi:hypothetical protein